MQCFSRLCTLGSASPPKRHRTLFFAAGGFESRLRVDSVLLLILTTPELTSKPYLKTSTRSSQRRRTWEGRSFWLKHRVMRKNGCVIANIAQQTHSVSFYRYRAPFAKAPAREPLDFFFTRYRVHRSTFAKSKLTTVSVVAAQQPRARSWERQIPCGLVIRQSAATKNQQGQARLARKVRCAYSVR
jgi:hypothetical protein